jgi:hypothetical protein
VETRLRENRISESILESSGASFTGECPGQDDAKVLPDADDADPEIRRRLGRRLTRRDSPSHKGHKSCRYT